MKFSYYFLNVCVQQNMHFAITIYSMEKYYAADSIASSQDNEWVSKGWHVIRTVKLTAS